MRIGYLIFLLLLAGCSSRFANLAVQNQIKPGRFSSNIAVTYFGSSTLLIDDGETQILIDGFMTRYKHHYIRKIAPAEQQILDVLAAHEICPNPENPKIASRSTSCTAHPRRGLRIVIPMHAHYDHALDSSYFAAWAGARLVVDASIGATFDATRKQQWSQPLDWGAVEFIKLFEGKNDNTQSIKVGEFDITLLRSHHLVNPLSKVPGKATSRNLKLPAHLWEFGEGTNLSIRIKNNGLSMLIVPSAGVFAEEPGNEALRSDVVFMGIGGLGWKPVEHRKRYWRSLLKATDARRVIPIHWDSDQVKLRSGDANFALASPRRFDATLDVFEDLAKPHNVEIIFAPPQKRFDPFLGLR